MRYEISLYDSKAKEYDKVAVLPERRSNPKRITNSSIRSYIKTVLGEEFCQKNQYCMLIVTHHERRERMVT